MFTPPRISNKLDITTLKTKNIFQLWSCIVPVLMVNNGFGVKRLEPAEAEKFKFDFEGLMLHKFNIRKEFIYPNMIANGYNSSTEYDGKVYAIRILDEKSLDMYYKIILRNLSRDYKKKS